MFSSKKQHKKLASSSYDAAEDGNDSDSNMLGDGNFSPLGSPNSPDKKDQTVPTFDPDKPYESKSLMKVAAEMGSMSGAVRSDLGIAAHLKINTNIHSSASQAAAPRRSLLSQPSGNDFGATPTNLDTAPSTPAPNPHVPQGNPFDSLAGGVDPILKAQLENVYRLKSVAEPMEAKTRRLHNHISELYKSIQKVCDDFHMISADISDMLPPNTNPSKNVSHKVAAAHEEVHNMVGVAIPAKIMPRFEQSLLGDLDLMMLHYVQEQKKFRSFDALNKANKAESDEGKMGGSPSDSSTLMSKSKKDTDKLKEAAAASEEGLQRLVEKEADMLDAWLFKFLQFQIHFWSETGQQVMSLQKPTGALAEQLKARKLDPSESRNILGEVDPETVVSSPGWGDESEATPSKGKEVGGGGGGGLGWFGGKKDEKEKGSEHAWLSGMFQRRNVEFFQKDKGGFDDDEDDSTSNPSSRSNSRRGSLSKSNQGSRRGSKDNGKGSKVGLNAAELSAKIDAAASGSNPLKRFSGIFGGNKRKDDKYSSQNGLLGSEDVGVGVPIETGAETTAFPRPPEQGAFPRPDINPSGKNIEGISSTQARKKSGSGSGGMFSAFQSGNGEKKGGKNDEWVDFTAGDESVEFDANAV
ncbi:hypothetical protein TrLO_g12164 [Triparma laevis f. longispina]|uniref:Uncharacterized protein n=1 Tax=Triparma laevis f. longispina TaxID=1714387 RepID=A0A9W7F3K2_9STRA|nr:hypothetical protein TrLO_g12164 [Triparma laevis f. longispina]